MTKVIILGLTGKKEVETKETKEVETKETKEVKKTTRAKPKEK